MIRATPYVVMFASVLAAFILLAQRIIQGGNPSSAHIALWVGLFGIISGTYILMSALIRKWQREARPARSRVQHVFENAAKSIPAYFVLAIHAWLLLLLIPLYFSVWLSSYNRQTYFNYGFMDKRGIVWGYLVTVGAFFILPAFFKRLAEASVNRPSTWGDFIKAVVASGPLGSQAPAGPRHWTIRLAAHFARVLVAVALATIFFGPPWHVYLFKAPIDGHEMMHLGGLQAIHRGSLPYVGAGSVQYGPGSQLLMYLYMKYSDQFTLVGFRESFAVIHWLAATILSVAVFLRFRLLLAATIVFIAVNLPPLTFFQIAADGTLSGFFGWGNGLRYLGALVLLLFLPTALDSGACSRTAIAKGFGLGLIFAFFCYLAQENLIAGMLSGLIFLIVGCFTQTYTTKQLFRVVWSGGLGFIVFWVPVLGFYAYHGQLLSFLDLYFLASKLFSHGYGNTAYFNGLRDPWGKTYYLMPVLVALLGGLALYRPNLANSKTKWSQERALIIAMAVFCLVAHTGAMFRADSWHLKNTMVGLAILAPCSAVYLPRLIGATRAATRWSLRILIAVAFLVLLPAGTWREASSNFLSVMEARKLDWLRPSKTAELQAADTTEAFRRVGANLIDQPHCCVNAGGGKGPQFNSGLLISMKDMTQLMAELKSVAGERVTYVQNVPGLLPGNTYFIADLVPAPIYADRTFMVVNTALLNKFLKYFKKDVASIQCIIADSEDSPETEIFKTAHPNYQLVQREFEGRPIYIFLADTSAPETKSQEPKPNVTK